MRADGPGGRRGPGAASAAPSAGWVAVVPVKELGRAKSRLAVDPELRPELALAMARDVVAAAGAAAAVRHVLVVTDDPRARDALAGAAAVVPDEPRAGLSAAVAHGAAVATARWPDLGVAVLAADLPALTGAALDAVLAGCGPGRSVVADAAGTGTVLLAASVGTALAPAYEGASFLAHRAAGADDATPRAPAGMRRDVDTLADLDEAVALGIGPATATALGR